MHSGFAPFVRVEQLGHSYQNYNAPANGAVISYHMNSAHNPFNFVAPVQANGYDAMGLIYSRYVILNSSIGVKLIANDSGNDLTQDIVVWFDSTQNVGDRADTWAKARERGLKMYPVSAAYLNENDQDQYNVKAPTKYKTPYMSHKQNIRKNIISDTADPSYFGTTSSAVHGSDPGTYSTCTMYCTYADGTYHVATFPSLKMELWFKQDIIYYGLKTVVAESG